jgi:hypothetical protein
MNLREAQLIALKANEPPVAEKKVVLKKSVKIGRVIKNKKSK